MNQAASIPVLTINAGSSSLKLAAFAQDGTVHHARATRLGGAAVMRVNEAEARLPDGTDAEGAVRLLLDALAEAAPSFAPAAVAHRIVVGGEHEGAARLTPDVEKGLAALTPLAPLHMPANLALVRVLSEALPDAAPVGCFDTAFHAALPEEARVFALPERHRALGVRRYGYHGLSYAGLTEWLARERPDLSRGRVVAAHLGSGASLCAIEGGRSVATTMGLTPLDGVTMGTRPGAVDPGALLFLLREGHETPASLEDALYRRSGLLGLSGVSGDMRDLHASDDPQAGLAIRQFCLSVAQGAAAMAASMGGCDALVFTGGIGENDERVRAIVTARLAFMGPPEVLVRRADEAGRMAAEARALLS